MKTRDSETSLTRRVPNDSMGSSTLVDGVVWDGKNPKAYAASFKIRA